MAHTFAIRCAVVDDKRPCTHCSKHTAPHLSQVSLTAQASVQRLCQSLLVQALPNENNFLPPVPMGLNKIQHYLIHLQQPGKVIQANSLPCT